MQKTLLLIPHEIAGLPVFGFGWVLIVIAIGLAVRLILLRKPDSTISQVLAGEGLVWGIIAAVVVFIFPAVELVNRSGQPVGMAVRGYGVMLLLGVVSAVALSAHRAKSRGIDPEIIYSMAPWVFVGGIVGARLFYIVQYREKFIGETIGQTLRNMVAFTEGGLVVYGSFIGGFLAASVFIIKNRLPLLKLGDAVIPCVFIGVFFGRIGCLMNGCCYGGRCEEGWSALHFPPGSAVYHDQLFDGELLGMKLDSESSKIQEVQQDGLAAEAGIAVGQTVNKMSVLETPADMAPQDVPSEDVRYGIVVKVDQQTYSWTPSQLPDRARPVHAAQLISSVSSLVLCLVLCGLSYVFRRDGALMFLGFAGYAVLRFVLEIVRVDEAGQFGTTFSISQWVSIFVLAIAVGGLFWVYLGRAKVAKEPESVS